MVVGRYETNSNLLKFSNLRELDSLFRSFVQFRSVLSTQEVSDRTVKTRFCPHGQNLPTLDFSSFRSVRTVAFSSFHSVRSVQFMYFCLVTKVQISSSDDICPPRYGS